MEPETPQAPISLPEVMVTHDKTRYIFLGIFVVIVVVGIVSWSQLIHAPQPVEQLGTEIAGWKTYTNKKHGFELQYPADWKIDLENQLMCEDSGCAGENAVTISPGPWAWIEINDYGGVTHDWRSINYGIDSVSVTSKVLHERNLFLGIEVFDDTPNKENYMKELDQILSTFKFTKPETTTTTFGILPAGYNWQIPKKLELSSYQAYYNDEKMGGMYGTIHVTGKEWYFQTNDETKAPSLPNWNNEDPLTHDGWVDQMTYKRFRITPLVADGPNGGVWGYLKLKGGQLSILLFSRHTDYLGEEVYSTTSPEEEPQFNCPCNYTSRVFLSDPVDIDSVLPK